MIAHKDEYFYAIDKRARVDEGWQQTPPSRIVIVDRYAVSSFPFQVGNGLTSIAT